MRRREVVVPHPAIAQHVGISQLLYYGKPYGAPTLITRDLRSVGGSYSQVDVCIDETHVGPPYHDGGPLVVHHRGNDYDALRSQGSYIGPWIPGTLDWSYVGAFYPACGWGDFQTGFSPAELDMEFNSPGSRFPSRVNASSYGPQAWNRFRPGNPYADLGVFVAEFRDVPRMLKDTANFFQNAWKAMGGNLSKPSKAFANHWLSAQFGWLPFVNDLRKFHQLTVNLEKRLDAIQAGNGQWQSRGGSMIDDKSATVLTEDTVHTGHLPPLADAFYVNPAFTGTRKWSVINKTLVWFKGSFRYWIPDCGTSKWRKRALIELYGAMPNPALVWELTPFSWLVDWVSNIGDNISNMDNGWADNLAARCAYVMKTSEVEGEFSSTCNLKSGVLSDTWTGFKCSWKSRAGASRFGFALTDADFSARQWSILAALGIQRYR